MKLDKKHYAFAVAALVVIAIAAYLLLGASPVVASGDNVSVYYTGTFTNGTVFDSNVGKGTLNFTVGSGQMIQGFDNGVLGMHAGENKTITVPANEAYGHVNPAMIIHPPLSAFQNHTAYVGMKVLYNSTGQAYQGTVIAVNKTNATVDFNSPLAGKTLVFTIRIISIHKKG